MAEDKSKVLGIRLDTEDMEELKSFMEQEGKGNKEFMQMLLNLYKMNKGKAKNISLIGDIEELEQHTNKIHQAFVNIIDKLEGQKESITEDKDKELLIYRDKVNSLKNDNETLKVDNSTLTEMLTKVNEVNNEIKEHNNQLQGNLSDKVTIIEEYKSKNDTLTGLLNEYKQYKEQADTIKGLLADSQAREIEKDNTIKDKDHTIGNLNTTIQAKDEATGELKDRHKAELQTATDRAAIAQDKALLQQQKEFNIKLQHQQEQLQQVQEKHNATIQEYQAKYKQLLEELEQVKKAKAPTTKAADPKK